MRSLPIYPCPKGACGSLFYKDELSTHDCVPCTRCGMRLHKTAMTSGECPVCIAAQARLR